MIYDEQAVTKAGSSASEIHDMSLISYIAVSGS
jgi:hypothetical protein